MRFYVDGPSDPICLSDRRHACDRATVRDASAGSLVPSSRRSTVRLLNVGEGAGRGACPLRWGMQRGLAPLPSVMGRKIAPPLGGRFCVTSHGLLCFSSFLFLLPHIPSLHSTTRHKTGSTPAQTEPRHPLIFAGAVGFFIALYLYSFISR